MMKLLALFVPSKVKDGFVSTQGFLSGKKTYLAASILLLQALAAIVDQIIGLNGVSGLLGWLKDMGSNEAIAQFGVALGLLGLRAGVEKSKEPVEQSGPEVK